MLHHKAAVSKDVVPGHGPRARLLSCTALVLSTLVLATPGFAGNGIGGSGGDGANVDVPDVPAVVIGTEPVDVDPLPPVPLIATGGNGADGDDGDATPSADGGPGTPGTNPGDNGGIGGDGGDSIGIGGQGGNGGFAIGRSIGTVTVDMNGDVTSGVGITSSGQAAQGGNGGNGGNGSGDLAGNGGKGGDSPDNPVPGAVGTGGGGGGGRGGSAGGFGGDGGDGGDGTGGSAEEISVDVDGSISGGVSIQASGGAGTGGNGGTSGTGTGGTSGNGGPGGKGGGIGNVFGTGVSGGAGGTGGTALDAAGAGGAGGDGGAGTGGNVGAISVTAGGAITGGVVINSTGGVGMGGAASNGGTGTGGTGGRGGAGGHGGAIGQITIGSQNQGGPGGSPNGLPAGFGDGSGGNGGNGGDAMGGSTGDIILAAGGNASGLIDIDSIGGAATGRKGGDGGLGIGGTAGRGGSGGGFGDIGSIDDGNDNVGGRGGDGGRAGTASGSGGDGGDGGDATGGNSGGIDIDVAGNILDGITLVSTGGAATAGDGGKGGDGQGKAGGLGGTGGSGGNIGIIGADGLGGDNNLGGTGGTGGEGGASDGRGGDGGHGGDAIGGNAGAISIDLVGETTGPVQVTAAGGTANGGKGGDGGDGTTAQAGQGGVAAPGGSQQPNPEGTGNLTGIGGIGGAGGSDAGASGGDGGHGGAATGGSVDVSITNTGNITTTGPAITITATAGHATGGTGGDGGMARAGQGGTGGPGGAGGFNGVEEGNGGKGGKGGRGGNADGGAGGDGGDAVGGNATVAVGNSGDITATGGNAITITATAGNATGGDSGDGGEAIAGAGGVGGAGGRGGQTTGTGGDGGNGGDAGNAHGGDGGQGGTAQAGVADVTVTNDGRIFSTANGIDITTTSGLATVGAGSDGGDASGFAASSGGQGGSGDFPGMPGDAGAASKIVEGGDPGASGAAGSVQGSASIAVHNNNLIDVDGTGIRAQAHGANSHVEVNNTGTVMGGGDAVDAGLDLRTSSLDNTSIAINNIGGLITADSLFAINTDGAATSVLSSGTVRGFVDFTDQDDYYENQAGGIFEARGTSNFGGQLTEDLFFNMADATVLSATDPTDDEHVRLDELETFQNLGLISMVDGGAGDTLTMSTSAPDGTFYDTAMGGEGRLAVDALLAAPGTGLSDRLIIDGSTGGSTKVSVNVVDVQGANLDGIPVVVVNGPGGSTAEENFDLENGPLNAGFFAWDLRLDGTTHELYTSGIGAGAYEFAAGITGAQDIWQQTAGTLMQRQADLRTLLGGTQVTPVADFAEPVEPTPVAKVTPGFWIKGVGAWLGRDEGNGITTTDRDQTIWGGLAGFDFGTENAGQVWMFGLFGGYLTSDLDFDETNTKWTYEGPSIGAYATYLDHAFFVDAMVKADFLDIDIDASNLAAHSGDADTDATNIGGRIDTGYKFGETYFVEPQASFAVVNSDIDDTDIFGGTVDFDNETSVRGRLGLRLGFDHTGDSGAIYTGDVTGSVWQEFNGDNDVAIFSPGFGSFGVSDSPSETVGDVSLGFSVAAPDGWSGFVRGDYQFADDYEAIIGNAGVRYAW